MARLNWSKSTRDRDTDAVPHWPGERREQALRVLVEHPDPVALDHIARGLRARGYEVVGCGGPDPAGPVHTLSCPVLNGQVCPAVDGADVIVSGLAVEGSSEGLIVQGIAENPGSPPMLVEATDWQVQAAFGDPEALTHRYPLGSVDDVATAIEDLRESMPNSR